MKNVYTRQSTAIVQAIQKSQPPNHAYTQNMAQASFLLNKPGFLKKSYDRKSAILVGVNSARNR